MKLNEIITDATKQDFAGCDPDSILMMAQKRQSAHKRIGWKKAILIAAAVCLFAGTASAVGIHSGFGKAFEHPIDPGHVEILSETIENEEVIWTITETWFDEYNIHIGGTVTTPEPLDPAGDHRMMCYYKRPGEETHRLMLGYIFASGECESAFIISSSTVGHGDGTFSRLGLEGDEVTLELKICMIHDYSRAKNDPRLSFPVQEYVTIPGTWTYTVKLESRDANTVIWNGTSKSRVPASSQSVVTSVMLNAFSLEIQGENLTYTYPSYEGMEENPVRVLLKMKDGTLLGDNDMEYRKDTSDIMIRCFRDPIDPGEVEAVILRVTQTAIPADKQASLTKLGWKITERTDVYGNTVLDGWLRVMEIPLQ